MVGSSRRRSAEVATTGVLASSRAVLDGREWHPEPAGTKAATHHHRGMKRRIISNLQREWPGTRSVVTVLGQIRALDAIVTAYRASVNDSTHRVLAPVEAMADLALPALTSQ
jgi:hypothetical protein